MRVFLDPLFTCFTLTWVAVAWMWWRGSIDRRRLIFVTISLAVLTATCTPIVVRICGNTLKRDYSAAFPPPADVDAIIVLSGGLRQLDDDWHRYQLADDTLYRCLAAADVYRELGGVPMFVSGGKVDPKRPGPTLAAAMRDFLIRYDVASGDIITEERSRNTFENAVETAKLLKERELRQPILITDATHLPRAVACFAHQEIDVIPCPAIYSTRQFAWSLDELRPSASAARSMRSIVHEWVGMLWYRIQGRI